MGSRLDVWLGVLEGVERQRVGTGRSRLLFEEAAENAGFLKRQLDFREMLHGRAAASLLDGIRYCLLKCAH